MNDDTTQESAQPKRFLVVVQHNNSRPLGDWIEEGHSFFTMTKHVAGKEYHELNVGEGCYREATTADGRANIDGKVQWIRYRVVRVSTTCSRCGENEAVRGHDLCDDCAAEFDDAVAKDD